MILPKQLFLFFCHRQPRYEAGATGNIEKGERDRRLKQAVVRGRSLGYGARAPIGWDGAEDKASY